MYIFRVLFDYITRNDEVFVFDKYCKICNKNTIMKMNKQSVKYNSNNRIQEFHCIKCIQYKTSYSMFPTSD
jgi:hypothetical protein